MSKVVRLQVINEQVIDWGVLNPPPDLVSSWCLLLTKVTTVSHLGFVCFCSDDYVNFYDLGHVHMSTTEVL